MHDHRAAAKVLFARFAWRHRLAWREEREAPVELLWHFPVQRGLAWPVTLGLQNGDALNFGVAGFWSHVFPFETAAAGFERALDASVLGEARIVHVPLGGRALQILDHGRWTTVYRANCLLPVPRRPRRVFTNATAAPEAPRPGEGRP